LKEDQLKVLKALSEAKSRMDLNMFAEKVNLTPNETIGQMQALADEGFLRKVGGGFGMTEKGKAALKAFTAVGKEMEFHFYMGIDQPTDCIAESVGTFYMCITQVSVQSLEFHTYRDDFEKWLIDVCKDAELASHFEGAKATELKGEELRKELLGAIDAKYGVAALA
jgi:predicted transcriptional regulator